MTNLEASRKIIVGNLVMLLIGVSLSAYAQQTDKVAYCEILGMKNFKYITTNVVYFDFGYKVDGDPRDKQGKPIKFKSMIEALNHMVNHGWEFVQAYSDVGFNHYLLKKEIQPIDSKEQEKIKEN